MLVVKGRNFCGVIVEIEIERIHVPAAAREQ